MSRDSAARVRLAELVAALSLGVDLGFGQPMEHVLRECLIALRLADRVGLAESDRLVVYYTALLVNVGCHSDAHEQAKWFSDDIALKGGKYEYEIGSLADARATLRLFGAGQPVLHRFRLGLEFVVTGRHDFTGLISNHSRLARTLAEQLGLPPAVQESVGASYEQWDGKGWPGTLRGADVPIAARLAQLAEFTEVAHRVGGLDAAVQLARKRSGRQFDPKLADMLCSDGAAVLDGLDSLQTWDAVIDAEPALGVRMTDAEFDQALLAIADFVDLKSPFMLGHARGVAHLAGAAGERLALPAADVDLLRRAALVHGWGRLGVSNSIWDKTGRLGPGELERVRLYPYLTERMLRQSPTLAPIGAVAIQCHEKLDGSGYPRQLPAAAISLPGRILAAAQTYQTKIEERPHRPALRPPAAAAFLRTEATAGRLDARAVDAVLEAAGHRVPRTVNGPARLTQREIDVLRLVARGLPTREIATRLVISPKTVRNHVEHIYAKIDATNRAGASLFAVRHGLLTDFDH
ncbi:MAG TPA: HD domain-containing phosphohydrolase [Mycobacteriales bacterium]|uniref:HD domain-containing phosphohydrolase n=1 Tax=Amycolatopsis sp. TaxID=37632 RepID=UPI002BE115D1|nr:HD domain-containing phosphohydrolase [Amycolatopsis sp.]HVV07618.1 HD domain-containing phosphohydrolase [Amycolatopsis sp.]HVX46840.1 HD domain-containing phosphohydrolase [Mycobacteriales bacterium]